MLTGCIRCSTASRDPFSISSARRGRADHADPRGWRFTLTRRDLDLLDDVHAGDDAAERRALSVERFGRRQDDEERAGRAGQVGAARHREDPAVVVVALNSGSSVRT